MPGYSSLSSQWRGRPLARWARAAAWAWLLPWSAAAAAQPASHAFTHVTVIDGTGSPPAPDMTVIVTGNRITAVGASRDLPLDAGTQVIDATGKYLIPGLWDMHVHTLSAGQPEQFFPLFVANGVTGVRDMGGDLPLASIAGIRREIESGVRYGPRLVAAGPILEGERRFWPFSLAVADGDQARRAVDSLRESGADFVKVYNSLSPDAYRAAASHARRLGVPLAGHVPEGLSPLDASRAGQGSIEHLWGLLIEIGRDPELLRRRRRQAQEEADPARARELFHALNRDLLEHHDPERARGLFERFAANGTRQTPTLVVLRAYASIHDPELRLDPRMAYIPRRIRDSWARTGGRRDPRNEEMQARHFARKVELVGEMHDAGVRILAGTDAPNPYTYPGFSLHDELELLVSAGLTPMEALQAATLEPARFLGLEGEAGTIAVGRRADLVLLDGDPLESIRNTRSIAAVVLNGRYLSRESLEAMLAGAAAAAGAP